MWIQAANQIAHLQSEQKRNDCIKSDIRFTQSIQSKCESAPQYHTLCIFLLHERYENTSQYNIGFVECGLCHNILYTMLRSFLSTITLRSSIESNYFSRTTDANISFIVFSIFLFLFLSSSKCKKIEHHWNADYWGISSA